MVSHGQQYNNMQQSQANRMDIFIRFRSDKLRSQWNTEFLYTDQIQIKLIYTHTGRMPEVELKYYIYCISHFLFATMADICAKLRLRISENVFRRFVTRPNSILLIHFSFIIVCWRRGNLILNLDSSSPHKSFTVHTHTRSVSVKRWPRVTHMSTAILGRHSTIAEWQRSPDQRAARQSAARTYTDVLQLSWPLSDVAACVEGDPPHSEDQKWKKKKTTKTIFIQFLVSNQNRRQASAVATAVDKENENNTSWGHLNMTFLFWRMLHELL